MTPAGAWTLSASKPSWLVKFGFLAVTGTPTLVMVLLKKLLAGFGVLLSMVPFRCMLSPVIPRSPSAATTLILELTVPAGGVMNPLMGMFRGGSPLAITP